MGELGTPEFFANYQKAVEEYRAPDTGRFRSIVVAYKASREYKSLADSTRKNRGALA